MSPTLTILFDNVSHDPHLQRLWGFSCLVEAHGRRVLFDTGSNGRVLLRNMRALGIDAIGLDDVFISHTHWDHIGGLDSIIELNPQARLIVPASLSPRMLRDLKMLVRKVVVVDQSPFVMAPGFFSTGLLHADVPEQALVVAGAAGPLVITGCAHPGIVTLASVATEQVHGPIGLLAGGFHLFEQDASAIDQVADALKAFGVRRVMPTHCSGDDAIIRLATRFGKRFLRGGVGRRIHLAQGGGDDG
jgi:7,8-dihydropterin-6-yl-methyl-4-(beta-D-ribofuranosyl)aminobenzene 5'-phosphate synthase